MADEMFLPPLQSSTIAYSPYSPDSKSIICDYLDEEEEDESIPVVYPPTQQSSVFYEYQNNQPSQGQLNFVHEDNSEETSDFIVDVPIQRVSSEDELNFFVKRKRAKFIGPYLFGDVIGHGSYAKVKECLDGRNLCRRAVKIMQKRRLRKTPHGEEMAETEIRLLKK
ncbi:unnamed protein product, partial [Rotaria magnacalcarata]